MVIRAIGYPNRGQNKGSPLSIRNQQDSGLTKQLQGFDEFMNLVIDDAVEVKQATKTDEEKRRNLGTLNTES